MTIRYIDKDPAAVLFYSVDWTEWLIGSDQIATSTMAVSTVTGDTSPLTIESTTNTGNIASVELSGGTNSNTYVVTNTITTNDGLTDVRRFRLRVGPRYL